MEGKREEGGRKGKEERKRGRKKNKEEQLLVIG